MIRFRGYFNIVKRKILEFTKRKSMMMMMMMMMICGCWTV